MGASKAWKGPRVEEESFTGENKAWEDPRESRESSIVLVNGPQEQYYSSCN
jgi:hypothetical protein